MDEELWGVLNDNDLRRRKGCDAQEKGRGPA